MVCHLFSSLHGILNQSFHSEKKKKGCELITKPKRLWNTFINPNMEVAICLRISGYMSLCVCMYMFVFVLMCYSKNGRKNIEGSSYPLY